MPARAGGVELLGPAAGSGYKQPPSLVRRADGQTLQLTQLLYAALELIDGRRTYAQIAEALSRRGARIVAPEDARWLIETKLRPLGLLRGMDGSEPPVKKAVPLLALRFRKVVSNPRITRRITAPFAWLFHPAMVIPVLAAFMVTTAWVLFEKGLAAATHQALHQPGMLLIVLGLVVLSAGFHEFGHAAACRYVGATPGAMGVGLYLVWPVFYTDVTDSYRLARRDRIVVDLGGLYFNAIFTVGMLGLWAATRWDAMLLLVPAQILHMFRQLIPFVRFDGYHILADMTGVPDLFAHIKPTLRRLVPGRGRKRLPRVLRPWVTAVVTLWVLTVIPVLVLALALIVGVFPRVAATLAESVGPRWGAVQSSWAAGDLATAAVGIVAIAAVGFPVLAMTYLLLRVARRGGTRVWRATDGRPAARAMAIVAGMVGMLLLAWAWWPDGQYRPIRPNERGTVLDAVQGSPAEPAFAPVSHVGASGVRSLTPRLALVVSEDGPVTEPGPKEIIILPEPGETSQEAIESEWVFPFAPPAPPEEGDTQALAVNTTDGSTEYDVAVAVVWVTDGSVENVNEAYAFASCSDCTTVAVAFQSVFVVGQADLVTPQNIAVAVNYECQACQTTALAVQFIATLTDMPTPEAMAELEAVWAEIEALEAEAGTLSVEQIYAEIEEAEAAIMQILLDDGVLAVTEDSLVEASIEAPATDETTDPLTAEGEEEAFTEEDGLGDDPSPSPTEEPSPTQEPSPSPSEEPSPTAEPSPSPSEEPSPTAEPSPSP